MDIIKETLPAELHERLKKYVYDVIGYMHYVHKDLGPGLPEYIYQEALTKHLRKMGEDPKKEVQIHPTFDGETLDAYVKMDLAIPRAMGNIIVECKSITKLGERERFQTFGYLRSSGFPIAILVNFGTWPKAEIERYYYKESKIWAF